MLVVSIRLPLPEVGMGVVVPKNRAVRLTAQAGMERIPENTNMLEIDPLELIGDVYIRPANAVEPPFHNEVPGTFHANVDRVSLDKVIEVAQAGFVENQITIKIDPVRFRDQPT